MRHIQIVRLCVLGAVFGAATAAAQEPGPSAVAARIEGYMGAAVVDGEGVDGAEFDGGGTGSITGLFGPVYFQADVFGDYTALNPDAHTVGFGGHLGYSDPERFAVGASFSYQEVGWELQPRYRRIDDDYVRGGAEAELYLGPATLGLIGGYLENAEEEEDGYYVRLLARYYLTENLKFEAVGGLVSLDSDERWQTRALVEFRPAGWPLGIFTRWEGAYDTGLTQNFFVAGFRLYLEGMRLDSPRSLRSTDRIYFREACAGFLLGARAC